MTWRCARKGCQRVSEARQLPPGWRNLLLSGLGSAPVVEVNCSLCPEHAAEFRAMLGEHGAVINETEGSA